ncbi:SSI family serine proteinase inhibitor [Motilibacter deserti]|uniref:Subtilisin inhibitor domain-containing protein n=1 Tax=Motilibacter deserti TaxID=2714956 RepID=A0ABX0H1U2_9ACTN|nr:SSI family serine proteinase inhibitor [Motilibacter deserti]NHC16311.1 hypothetical protein [Motilibacter deserti]
MRTRPALLAGALTLAAALALAGCGDEDGGTPGSAAPATSGSGEPGLSPAPSTTPSATPGATASTAPGGASSPAPAGPTRLQVQVDLATSMEYDWRLTCDPPGGDHPRPADACAALAAYGLDEVPAAGQACTEQFGGPETARVRGTLAGEPVDLRLDRTDGCHIAQWSQLRPLLQPTT